MECYLTITFASFPFLEIMQLKCPNSEKGAFTYQKLICEESLICKNLLGNIKDLQY